MHLPELISDLAMILLTGGIVTLLFRKLNQPLVLGYILAGFLIGPYMPMFFTVGDSDSPFFKGAFFPLYKGGWR